MTRSPVILIGGPGNADDLMIPMAHVLHVPPPEMLDHLFEDLPYMLGGMAAKPTAPLVWKDSMGTNIIPGFGVIEAAELQELAYKTAAKRRADWRERFGFPDRQSFDQRLREHMDERTKRPADRKWHQHD